MKKLFKLPETYVVIGVLAVFEALLSNHMSKVNLSLVAFAMICWLIAHAVRVDINKNYIRGLEELNKACIRFIKGLKNKHTFTAGDYYLLTKLEKENEELNQQGPDNI